MSRFNHKKAMSRRDITIRILFALIGLIIVVTLLPRNSSHTYTANIDHPWHSRELVAPFEFPLLKSEAVLEAERDSVCKLCTPYFNLDERIKVKMLSTWRKDIEDKHMHDDLPQSVISRITSRMQKVYDFGVLDASSFDTYVTKARATQINIVSGKLYVVRDVAEVFTHKSAYQYLLADSTISLADRQVLQRFNLSAYILPNLVYDTKKSEAAIREALDDILPTSGRVLKGTRIVDRGEIVTPEIALKIKSFNAEMERRDSTVVEGYGILLGQMLYCAIFIVGIVFFLYLFRSDYIADMKHIMLMLMLVVTMPAITALDVRLGIFSVYVIPYAMIPIVARIFMDSRTAAMTLVTSVMLSAVSLSQQYDFIAIEIVAGLVAIYSLHDLSERSQLFRCTLYVTLVSLLMRLSLDLVHEGGLSGIGWLPYISLLIGGVLLLFVYPLLFMFERLFGFTSNVTLVELSNVNTPLLRRLSEEAPGTFQHCLQVANLAADVANAIGGKSQLVRTGALYHDIGKLKHPVFFTENQKGINPHDRLLPVQSASVIIGHVEHGLELAAKHNLPKAIRDFIVTHHGVGKVMYFYIKEKERVPGEEVAPQPFTYPGPDPTTVEQAILMMADSVEAASRSLREYTDESITALVEKIVDGQVAAGHFKNCPITFADIVTSKKVLSDKLRMIYHTRISYPDLK